jgi:hypothetical protein
LEGHRVHFVGGIATYAGLAGSLSASRLEQRKATWIGRCLVCLLVEFLWELFTIFPCWGLSLLRFQSKVVKSGGEWISSIDMENQTLWADYIITRKRVAERSRQDKTSQLRGTLSFCSNGQQRIAAMTEIDTAAVVGVPHPRWDERPIAVACRWEIFYDIFEQVCLSKCVYFVTIILKMHEERTHMHPLLNLSVLT